MREALLDIRCEVRGVRRPSGVVEEPPTPQSWKNVSSPPQSPPEHVDAEYGPVSPTLEKIFQSGCSSESVGSGSPKSDEGAPSPRTRLDSFNAANVFNISETSVA